MTMRAAILDDYQQVAATATDWSRIRGLEVVSFAHHFGTEEKLATALEDFDIVVTLRERVAFPRTLFARLPRLRLLIASGLRNSVIDLPAAAEHGVTVCGTESSSAPPVELTWALILALSRHLDVETSSLRGDGPWQNTVGKDLCGRRLGLLGLGKIGSRVAAVGLAFGMDVLAWSENLTSQRAEEIGVTLAGSKDELLATSDVISVHLVLGDRTRSLLSDREFALMQPSALLVNTSRAAIIDQEALTQALRAGQIAGAAVDVFDDEPLPSGHPLRSTPRLLATPHLGYVTENNYRTYFGQAVEDIAAFLAGDPIRCLTHPNQPWSTR